MNFGDIGFGNGKEETGLKLSSYLILIIDSYTTLSTTKKMYKYPRLTDLHGCYINTKWPKFLSGGQKFSSMYLCINS